MSYSSACYLGCLRRQFSFEESPRLCSAPAPTLCGRHLDGIIDYGATPPGLNQGYRHADVLESTTPRKEVYLLDSSSCLYTFSKDGVRVQYY